LKTIGRVIEAGGVVKERCKTIGRIVVASPAKVRRGLFSDSDGRLSQRHISMLTGSPNGCDAVASRD
jgi:hypothetical protein